MPIILGSNDLLYHDTKHSVLICRECKYAIQKSALESHLLRHKIYRGERKRLLTSIAPLALLEPDGVQLPPAGSLPVDGLPVISGYRCTATGCESLCASSKRMKQHWREIHGVCDPPDSCAISVNLQTFFRGTKIRYFEVAMTNCDRSSAQEDDLDLVVAPVPLAQNLVLPSGPPCDLDLETLRYFHHFTTTTSYTLPTENHGSANQWQNDVIVQALRLQWLMCGLLSLSANHLAVISNDETTRRLHHERGVRFFQHFSAKWEDIKRNVVADEAEQMKLAAQISCIQLCYHWAPQSSALGQRIVPEAEPYQLESFATAIQGSIDSDFALRSALCNKGISQGEMVQPASDIGERADSGICNRAPPAVRDRLRTLPYRMAEVLEKPDNAQDFFASVAAINSLVECCALSYASDDVRAVWLGMASWFKRLSDHFRQMLRRSSPAALIVLAHWLLLVERAERNCWFLRGSATKVLHQIVGEMPENIAVRRMVHGLVDVD
jgi:hypothetical protein